MSTPLENLAEECPGCWGEGTAEVSTGIPEIDAQDTPACETCGGTGKVVILRPTTPPHVIDAIRILDASLTAACGDCYGSSPATCGRFCECPCHTRGVPQANFVPELCGTCAGVGAECRKCEGKGWR